jgi:Spy/CpxP family protein refolding chaperone
MKRQYGAAAVALVLLLGASLSLAYANPWRHHGHHEVPGMMAVWAVLQPSQKDQVKAIFEKEGPVLKAQHTTLKMARVALEQALLSGGDVDGATRDLEKAHKEHFEERVKIAKQIVALLTPQQRSSATELLSKVVNAHREIESAFAEARKQAAAKTQ